MRDENKLTNIDINMVLKNKNKKTPLFQISEL